jgi:hypothetical protein
MPEVLLAWASFIVVLHALSATPRAPSLALAPQDQQAAPAFVDVAAAPPPAAHQPVSSLRLSRNVDVSVSSLLKSLGAATYYRVAPGLALGAGPSVAALELPSGRLRALQLFTVLRLKF